MSYFVYMLKCVDGSFYLGSTDDVEKRFRVHLNGKGARYTRSHKPIKIVYREKLSDKSSALKREAELKKLSHVQKFNLTLV